MPLFIDALKQYNKNEIKWTVPKRGTEDYNKVMKIMNELKAKTATPANPATNTKKPATNTKKQVKKQEKPLQVSMPLQ